MVQFNPADYHNESTHLSINHEATIGLDSTNAFEGPEKLLEVWFAASPADIPATCAPGGLKAVHEQRWKDMLDLVKCKVLSVVTSEDVDAYLLSESSMFVFPHKLILKTCGTTTLLQGLPDLLEIAALDAGFAYTPSRGGKRAAATTYRVFYSRKAFMFPTKQLHPHRSWNDEIACLDSMFIKGSAYMIGKMNGEHWYLYTTSPNQELTPPASPIEVEHGSNGTETKMMYYPNSIRGEDETLEVLMTDLDPIKAKQFYLDNASAVAHKQFFGTNGCNTNGYVAERYGPPSSRLGDSDSSDSELELECPAELTTEGHALGTVVAEACGLVDVYPKAKFPEARIDSYLFTPCGFSANAVIPTESDTHYWTVHVTPEPHCSYASFETNVPGNQTGRETVDVIQHVVDIFKPGKFSVTLFEARPMFDPRFQDVATLKRSNRMDKIKGYRRVDRIVHDLEGYDLVFRYYEREDWNGPLGRNIGYHEF
ncbi:spermidine resistance protein [Arthrobotrys musiformis]|uniref:adenosylmethionine decarboxylase n=1 Tax=Arthrobotrys musiformis TaxID=47236 RepID=A0AAV9VXL5_9PEZI